MSKCELNIKRKTSLKETAKKDCCYLCPAAWLAASKALKQHDRCLSFSVSFAFNEEWGQHKKPAEFAAVSHFNALI